MTDSLNYTNICWVKALTRRQAEVLRFISRHTRQSGFPPSVRDIGDRFGLNPATVHDHIKALERKGHILRRPNQSRSLVVVSPGADNVTVGRPGVEFPGEGPGAEIPGIEVPIVGQVAAGAPILAEENVEDKVRLPTGWAPAGSFLLRVQGDSMRDAHILNGDYVLVRPDRTASNGEIVVALIEDEATVKRFFRKKDSIELRSENPKYQPIEVRESDEKQFTLVGKVIGVFRI